MPCYTTVRSDIRDLHRALTSARDMVPLSVTMKEKVEAIRKWGRTRARGAA